MDAVGSHGGVARRRLMTRGGFSWSFEVALGLQIPLHRIASAALLWSAVGSVAGGLAASLLFPPSTWQNLAGAVAANMGGTAWLLWWLGRVEKGRLVVSPLTGLLTLYALRRLLGLIMVVEQGPSLASPFELVPTEAYLAASAKAEWVTLVGTAALCAGWVLARRRRPALRSSRSLPVWRDRQLWMAYSIGLAVFLAKALSPMVVSRLGRFIEITSDLSFGAVFVLLAYSATYGVNGVRRFATYAALLPLLTSVLSSGSKGAFFSVLLPVGVAYLLRKPGRGIALSTAGVLFLLVFVYPYVHQYRRENWGEAAAGATVGQVAQMAQRGIEREGVGGTIRTSWEQFELRFGSVNEAGAVIYLADNVGFMGGFLIRNLAYGFIPRLLWPNKPAWDPARWFTDYLANGQHLVSATALHVAPELYWMYGWLGAVIGTLFLGLLYRRISDYLLQEGSRSPVFLAGWYTLLINVTFVEELRYNMAVMTPIILLCNLVAVSWLLRVLVPRPAVRAVQPVAAAGWVGGGRGLQVSAAQESSPDSRTNR